MDLFLSYLPPFWTGMIVLAAALVVTTVMAIFFRTVVSTNIVHIVQSRRKTTSYGTGQSDGNVYYSWPSWVPRYGITVIMLPVSNFDLSLKAYEAYDKDRVPFVVDVTAFFRIKDAHTAAQRISSYQQLVTQLTLIVQGAVRKVIASANIDEVMLKRAEFGAQFTEEVKEQLAEWGVEPVKSMELMDIRDHQGSEVIANIMAKKISHIAMDSRMEVAKNNQAAETAEIEARQAVDIRDQEAKQAVGERTAQKDKAVGVAQQQATQEVLSQEKETRERAMQVKRVDEVRQAEITKDQQVVFATQDKETTVLRAEGQLTAQQREAEGITVIGAARASAEKAMQLAPVEAQITLAKEIGTNPAFQGFLQTLEAIKAHITVGSKQAEALQKADVKIIANAGNPGEGMNSVMDMFTAKGGTNIAAMVEGLSQTPMGKALLEALGVSNAKPVAPAKPAASAQQPEAAPSETAPATPPASGQ